MIASLVVRSCLASGSVERLACALARQVRDDRWGSCHWCLCNRRGHRSIPAVSMDVRQLAAATISLAVLHEPEVSISRQTVTSYPAPGAPDYGRHDQRNSVQEPQGRSGPHRIVFAPPPGMRLMRHRETRTFSEISRLVSVDRRSQTVLGCRSPWSANSCEGVLGF